MKLWRLVRAPFVALDGAGPLRQGARYTSPGRAVVNFASEPGLAVLVALRYLESVADAPDDYLLGWTEIDAVPERFPLLADDTAMRNAGDDWHDSRRSLLAAVTSKVLPEADVVMMNCAHPDAARAAPLVTRPFHFAECLHVPPMLARYGEDGA